MASAGHRVVIAGGGVAALEALIALRRLAEERVDIELVAPNFEFSYRPLAVAEPFGAAEHVGFELAQIAADHGAGLRRCKLTGVDPAKHSVRTDAGDEIVYDSLIVACGARHGEGLPGAITFFGSAGVDRMRRVVTDIEGGKVRRVVFAMGDGPGWPLPLYELALLTSAHAAAAGAAPGLTITTPEAEPLELFGARASGAVREVLEERRIGLWTGVRPAELRAGELTLEPAGSMLADRVVTLPRWSGPAFEGLPRDEDGFIGVDGFAQVEDVEDVYAAGDVTSSPVKQGGLAAQQADAAAQCIAQVAGAPVEPEPFSTVLRGTLLTGGQTRYLRAEGDGREESSEIADHALWWPPGKIAGRHLSPYLAELAGAELHPPAPPHRDSVDVTFEAG